MLFFKIWIVFWKGIFGPSLAPGHFAEGCTVTCAPLRRGGRSLYLGTSSSAAASVSNFSPFLSLSFFVGLSSLSLSVSTCAPLRCGGWGSSPGTSSSAAASVSLTSFLCLSLSVSRLCLPLSQRAPHLGEVGGAQVQGPALLQQP